GERGHGLAAAGFADDRQRLAARHIERDAAHGIEPSGLEVEGDPQILDVEQSLARHQFRPSGAVTSRRPSPSRLIDSTRRKSATPGIVISQALKNMNSRPSEIISPQDGIGGWTPSPRNESAASRMMACAISSVATTIR